MSHRYTTKLLTKQTAVIRDHRNKCWVEVTYDVQMDASQYEHMAEKAYNNRSQKYHEGPIQVSIAAPSATHE